MIGPKFHRLAQLFTKYKKYRFYVSHCVKNLDTRTMKQEIVSVTRERSIWEGQRMGCQRVSRLDKGESRTKEGGMVSKPE